MPESVEAGYKEMPWLSCLYTQDIIVSELFGKGETRMAKPEEIEWYKSLSETTFMERKWMFNKDHSTPESLSVEEKDSLAIAGKGVDTRVRFLTKPGQKPGYMSLDDETVVG